MNDILDLVWKTMRKETYFSYHERNAIETYIRKVKEQLNNSK